MFASVFTSLNDHTASVHHQTFRIAFAYHSYANKTKHDAHKGGKLLLHSHDKYFSAHSAYYAPRLTMDSLPVRNTEPQELPAIKVPSKNE